jgi:hypothetical protein
MDNLHYGLAAIIVILLVYIAWNHCGFSSASSASSASPASAAPTPTPAAVPASAPAGTGAQLISMLQKKADWMYYDEKVQGRVILTFKFDPAHPNTFSLKLNVSKDPPTTLNWVFQGPDSVLATEQGKTVDQYSLVIKYVDAKTIHCLETDGGKVSFDQNLN